MPDECVLKTIILALLNWAKVDWVRARRRTKELAKVLALGIVAGGAALWNAHIAWRLISGATKISDSMVGAYLGVVATGMTGWLAYYGAKYVDRRGRSTRALVLIQLGCNHNYNALSEVEIQLEGALKSYTNPGRYQFMVRSLRDLEELAGGLVNLDLLNEIQDYATTTARLDAAIVSFIEMHSSIFRQLDSRGSTGVSEGAFKLQMGFLADSAGKLVDEISSHKKKTDAVQAAAKWASRIERTLFGRLLVQRFSDSDREGIKRLALEIRGSASDQLP